jgi:hypothetical protein
MGVQMNESETSEGELDDETLEGVAGGAFAKSLPVKCTVLDAADEAATMTAIALAESGGNSR